MAGDLASKVEDMPEGATRIMQLLLSLFIPSAVAVVIATSLFASLHPVFGLVVCGWFSLHIIICLLTARACSRLSDNHAERKSQINGKIVDSFSNTATVKSFARRAWEYSYIQGFQRQEKQQHTSVLRLIFFIRLGLGQMCFAMMGVLMFYLMITRWQQGIITPGELGYIFYSGWGICVMAWISGIELPNFFKEIGTCKQALRPLQASHEITDALDAKPLNLTRGHISFNNVTFHYQRNNNLFENKHVDIEAGKKTGLVGFSGSGKTSFVNLILRFFEVESGQILIDGQDISKVTQDSLHEHISMIPAGYVIIPSQFNGKYPLWAVGR